MIAFAKDCYFEEDCPECGLTEIRLRYVLWGQRQVPDSPEIIEQRCKCFLGQDYAEDALARHLDYEEWAARWKNPDPRWDGD